MHASVTVIPNSSLSSRMSVCSGRSLGSTLPPGNSHNPAIARPAGRCANRTRPSASRSAHAATRTSFTPLRLQMTRRVGKGAPLLAVPTAAWPWWARFALPTLPATTRDRPRRGSRPVIAVDRDILFGEVAGEDAVAAAPDPDPDLELDDLFLHRSGYFGLVIVRVTHSLVGDPDSVEPDRQAVAVRRLSGLADGHD